MRPPKGYEAEKFPLLHRLIYSCSLSMANDTQNTVFLPIVRSSSDVPIAPDTIQVNPHNTNYQEDAGPLCASMSIIDRMRISLKFTMTNCGIAHHYAGQSTNELFEGEDVPIFNFKWRPIFNIFPEKLDAADDDTGTTVASILGMTKDATNEDVVPLTTNKLPTSGPAELDHPLSTANHAEAIADYNYSTDASMEDHVFSEDTLQTALRRYTNKGALRSCLGRTRNVTLTRERRPYANFYIDKFVPRAIRRI